MCKKFLCVILSVAMLVSMVTLPGFAAGAADLSAGYVAYTDTADAPITSLTGGAAVKASATISNAGGAAANAVMWTATYDNGVLVSTAYSAVSVPAGGSTPVSVTTQEMPADVTNVVLYTYIWDSFTNMNSIAPVATFPSSNTDLASATFNGTPIEFDMAGKAGAAMTEAEYNAGIAITAEPADNATKVVVGEPTGYPGSITITATSSDGTERVYTFNIKEKLVAGGNTKVYDVPTRESIGTQVQITPNGARPVENKDFKEIKPFGPVADDSSFYTDRLETMKFVTTGSKLLGATSILVPRDDAKSNAVDFIAGQNEYFHVTANEAGTIYVKFTQDMSMYEADKSWTKVTEEGSTPPNYNSPEWWNNGGKAPDSYTYDPDAFPYYCNMIQYAGGDAKPACYLSKYKVTYYKHFEAGEDITIYTQGVKSDQNIVTLIQWDEAAPVYPEVDVTLKSLTYNGISVPGFAPEKTAYSVMVDESVSLDTIEVAGVANNDDPEDNVKVEVTKGDVADKTLTVKVRVYAEDGTEKVYTINFMQVEPNKIIGFKTGSQFGIYGTDGYGADRAAMTAKGEWAIHDDLNIGSGDANGDWVYSDRDNVFYKPTTSEYFRGATYIRPAKNDGGAGSDGGSKSKPYFSGAFDGKNGNPYWVEFTVSSGATVYFVDNYYDITAGSTSEKPNENASSEPWPNMPDDWSTVPIEDNLIISTTHLTGSAEHGSLHFNHYEAGETVQIPNYGVWEGMTDKALVYDPPIYVIVWDEQQSGPSSNANLASLKYDDTEISVTADKDTYDVVLPEAKTVTLTWTFADDGAVSEPASGVEVAVAEEGTTSQTIVVTAEDGTQKTYTVNFTVESVESNTIYDITYASNKKYAVQTMKRSTPESVNDGTAEPTWMYSGYVGFGPGDKDDNGNYKWNAPNDPNGQAWAIFRTDNVSPYFEGMTVFAMDKGEAANPTKDMKFFTGAYDGKGSNPYWLTFRVSSPATVYYKDNPGAGWFNKPADWKFVSADAKLYILSAKDGAKLYYKHYEANELVQIPNYGFSESWKPNVDRKATEPGGYFIVWDELLPYEVTISGDDNVTAGTPVTLSAAVSKTEDDSAVEGASFNWVITDGTDKATIDAATGVLTPTVAGTITVAAATADGTAIGYKDITIGEAVGPVEPAISNIVRNPNVPLNNKIETTGTNRGKLDINNKVYSDRDTMTFAHVSSFLKGADIISVPLNDVRVSIYSNDSEETKKSKQAQIDYMNGDNDYFTFDVNADCTVYVLSHNPYLNYTEDKGWVTVNNGTGITLPVTVGGEQYDDLKTVPFDYNPEDLKYYATRVQWQNNMGTEDQWVQGPNVSEVGTMKYVYAKNVSAGSTVTIPTPGDTAQNPEETKVYPHTFAVAVKWETDTLVPVDPDISGGVEEGGEFEVKTAASVEVAANAAGFTVTAAQDPTSAKISVAGTSDGAYGTLVPVVVYKPGKTPAMADAAVAAGESLDSIIAGVVQTTVKKNNTYAAEITLSEELESGSIEIWAADGANRNKVTLDFVNPISRLAAMKAIIDAANLTGEDMPAALAEAIEQNLGELDGNIALFNSLSDAGKEFVAEYVAPKIKDIDETDISKYKEVADPIDDATLLAALSEGKLSGDDLEAALDKLGGSELADKVVSIYRDGINEDGQKTVLANMKKSTYYASWTEAQSAFMDEVVVNAVAYPTSARKALESIQAFKDLAQLSGCNWTSFNTIVNAGKGTQFAINLTAKKPTSYTDYVEKFNEVAASMMGGINGGGNQGGGNTGGGNGSGGNNTDEGGGTIIIDPTPDVKDIDDFTDANEAVWAKPALQTMLEKKIFAGYEDNTIRPNNNATREEVIKILVSTFFTVNKTAISSFSDVEAGSWYYPYVATGEAKGITKGMGDGTFGVGQNITRQDFAVMIYNYMLDKGVTVNTTPYEFVDDDAIADYARDAIYALKNANIIKGYEDNTVAPEGSATRAEIAQMVANLIVLLGL